MILLSLLEITHESKYSSIFNSDNVSTLAANDLRCECHTFQYEYIHKHPHL